MARYIDADALIEDFRDYAEANKGTYHEEGFKNAITVVEVQPTADVVDKERYDRLSAEYKEIRERLYLVTDELELLKVCCQITGKAGEKEKTEYEEQQGKSRSEEGSGDPEA